MGLNRYRNRVLAKGRTAKDRLIFDMRQSYYEILEKSPNSHEIMVNNKPYTLLLQDRRFLDEELKGKYIIAPWDIKFGVGDYVKALGKDWFIDLKEEETVEANNAYRILPCNEILKWQDQDGRIYEFPCVAGDKTSVYSDGLSRSVLLTTPVSQNQVVCPTNKYTKMLNTNDRFIFAHEKYHVYFITRIDRITFEGLTVFVMKRDEYNPDTDNLEENLSNPIGMNANLENNIITPENPKDEIDYSILEIIGQPKVSVFDENIKYEVPNVEGVSWEIDAKYWELIETQENAVILNPTGEYGTVVLKAIIGDKVIEKNIDIGFTW